MGKRSPEERFWAKVDKHGPVPQHRPELGPCWPWKPPKEKNGYARFDLAPQRKVYVHRHAYTLLVGPIPDGLEPDHLCHDPKTCPGGNACPHRACCNPGHMEPVTHAENMRRGFFAVATHCPKGHPYDEANTYRDGRGCRRCRMCNAANQRAWQQRQQAKGSYDAQG